MHDAGCTVSTMLSEMGTAIGAMFDFDLLGILQTGVFRFSVSESCR